MGTVYQPSNLSPNGISVDFGLPQMFSSQVNGSLINYYQDVIRRVDTNAILYDSTKTAISPALYDKDILSRTISAGVITYKGQVKWTRTTWSDLNFATSGEKPFYSATTPVVSLPVSSPITSKSHTFLTTYTQAESVAVVNYQYFLYDSNSKEIDRSDIIYSSKLSYTFDGFVANNNYQVRCLVTNAYGTVSDTGLVPFLVTYSIPTITVTPSVEQIVNQSSNKVKWTNGVQIIGTATGTTSYVSNYLVVGNYGYRLNNNSSYAEWNVNIPQTFTFRMGWEPDGFTSGKIVEFDDGMLYIGYDGSKFYINVNGTVYNGKNLTLNTNPYVLAIKPNQLLIIQNDVILDYIKPWWLQ